MSERIEGVAVAGEDFARRVVAGDRGNLASAGVVGHFQRRIVNLTIVETRIVQIDRLGREVRIVELRRAEGRHDVVEAARVQDIGREPQIRREIVGRRVEQRDAAVEVLYGIGVAARRRIDRIDVPQMAVGVEIGRRDADFQRIGERAADDALHLEAGAALIAGP
ncbi:MAG: hypothetical protein WDM81_08810 [Rhizomicrobium sp.]